MLLTKISHATWNFQKMNCFDSHSLNLSHREGQIIRRPLATKSLNVFCKGPLPYKIFPISPKMTLNCRPTYPPSTLQSKCQYLPKVDVYNFQ